MFTPSSTGIYQQTARKVSGHALKRVCALFISMATGLALLWIPKAFSDNSVNLRLLVITTGDESQDIGLAYIRPVLDEMGMPYDVLNAGTQDLTAAMLAASSGGNACSALEAGCVGNYNGIILTVSDLTPNFTPSEWDLLHAYETDFHVREAVLSGWPATYSDADGVYLDYGLVSSSSGAGYEGKWAVPIEDSKAIFEYVNQANPLAITDFAYAAVPRNNGTGLRDGTVTSVTPLLKTPADEALVSLVHYTMPGETTPAREVLISTITNAWFLLHSQVLAYEFVNWATQGVFVGSRFVYMAAHLDDLFLADELWDIGLDATNPNLTYRLNSGDITNAVSQQAAFRAAHPTAGIDFKLDFPFNGLGALDPTAKKLDPNKTNKTEDLVVAVVANKEQFRFINHTLTHADMDKAPWNPPSTPCDYPILTTVKAIQAEISDNQKVWDKLKLPEQKENERVLVTGNHSGLKDRNCTDYPEFHPEMGNVQADDMPFPAGANPLLFEAANKENVDYLASDASQLNQAVEQYVTEVDDGDKKKDRLMLPRWPTNLFYNVIDPDQLVDEYNYIFHERFVNASENPCLIPGAICEPREYPEILVAEADTALRHMLSFKKWPHFFHQTNLAQYQPDGSTLQFDWLSSVYSEYEKLFTLPVKNYPFYQIGDLTKDRLIAKSATIQATWDRTTNQVTLSADMTVPSLRVTGLAGGEFYGGQFIREIKVEKKAKRYAVDQALAQ